MSSNQPTFKLGITMAGAVSAGAYTAGVMDYLLEALELWEKAKQKNRSLGSDHIDYDHTLPMHDVVLEVLAGASAGGMTAAITAAAIQTDIAHLNAVDEPSEDTKSQNKLYSAWVNLMADDMMPMLLDMKDLEEDNVISLLNSSFIEKVADKTIYSEPNEKHDRPYISKDLELIMSMSNLKGISYKIGLRSDLKSISEYRATQHRDWGHFLLTDDGYRHNGKIPISFSTGENLETLKASAMATGAFPLGLESREVVRKKEYIEDNRRINPIFPRKELHIDSNYRTLNVDGGLLDNEPFEVTQDIVMEKIASDVEDADVSNCMKEAATFCGTVLMIDPFPSEEDTSDFNYDRSLVNIAFKVLSTMRSQLVLKEADLNAVYDKSDYSRFLIAPKRRNRVEGSDSIACGSLGGFGGFFSKQFREHDFFLGRRNCQRFLTRRFNIPIDSGNPIFEEGYSKEAKEQFKVKKEEKYYLPIIPNLNTKKQSYIDWPSYSLKELKGLKKKMRKRLVKIILTLFNLKHVWHGLGWVGTMIFRWNATNRILNMIKADFQDRDLLGK